MATALLLGAWLCGCGGGDSGDVDDDSGSVGAAPLPGEVDIAFRGEPVTLAYGIARTPDDREEGKVGMGLRLSSEPIGCGTDLVDYDLGVYVFIDLPAWEPGTYDDTWIEVAGIEKSSAHLQASGGDVIVESVDAGSVSASVVWEHEAKDVGLSSIDGTFVVARCP